MAICRSCGAEIIWAKTQSGKSMPLDVAPVDHGNIYLSEGIAHVNSPLAPGIKRYISHFATCPNGAKHRKGKTNA